MEHLPDYMKICFKALHDVTCEISDKIYKKHGFNPIDFLRKSVYLLIIPVIMKNNSLKLSQFVKNNLSFL